jgi:hypothetical protein
MAGLRGLRLLVLLLVCTSAALAEPRAEFEDPLHVRPLTPVFDLYPDASLVDYSYLLDAPAGKHGFVQRDGDCFTFEDGSPARFWGVVITQEHIDIPKDRIDQVVDVLARSGCNMVRFHSLDNPAGYEYGFRRRTIIDDAPPNDNNTQHFDAEYLDRVHYWMAELKKRGIYSFLVLRAFREYREGDGVANAAELDRGARPQAFFNERLIELQKHFARDLLVKTVNPYTGLTPAKDPAVALIELFNEDSLFSRPQAVLDLKEPYRSQFLALWHKYLKEKYGTSEKLAEAWGEQIALEDVPLPDLSQSSAARDEKPSPRRGDEVHFAMEVQRSYFRDMRDALREMGVRVPMTGVVAGRFPVDALTVAQELDFTAENMYQEHPSFAPDSQWLPPFYYKNENYLTDTSGETGMPFILRYHWDGVPVFVREWATSWPNEFRAASMMEMAAYARLNGIDGMTYFAYYTTGDFTRIGAFTLNSDPARWSLFGQAAELFLGKQEFPTSQPITIPWTMDQLLQHGTLPLEHYTLGWERPLANQLVEEDAPLPKLNETPLRRAGDVIVRDTVNGMMFIDTAQTAVIQGTLPVGKEIATPSGVLRVSSQSPFAVFVAQALDGEPLKNSKRYVIKMVTVAGNRSQLLRPSTHPQMTDYQVMVTEGTTPIVTNGRRSEEASRVWLDGKPLLDAYMTNGQWELIVDAKAENVYLACDTPNAEFALYPESEDAPKRLRMTRFQQSLPEAKVDLVERRFTYPGWAKYVMLEPQP